MDCENIQTLLHPDKQRKYICDAVIELVYDDVVAMYRFLSTHVNRDEFNVHGNGCSVNLDNIPDYIVSLVYNLIRDKLNE
jgi:hypothetical protein